MKAKLTDTVTAVVLVTLALVFLNTSTQAEDAPNKIGYAKDSTGTIVRSGGSQNCVRTSSRNSTNQVLEGCDGVVMAITDPGVSMFAFDSAELTPEGKAVIDKHRGRVEPQLASGYTGQVIGYTDSSGDPTYNMWLSQQRAQTVRNYLLGSETSSAKVDVIGRGAKYPTATNDTREGRAMNRRVEVIFVDKKSAAK
jgi:outer membrane protein OmpA-like peptidoglycan-associated protein